MTGDTPPLERIYDLGDLSQAGAHIVVEAAGDDLIALAQWAGIDGVEGLAAPPPVSDSANPVGTPAASRGERSTCGPISDRCQ